MWARCLLHLFPLGAADSKPWPRCHTYGLTCWLTLDWKMKNVYCRCFCYRCAKEMQHIVHCSVQFLCKGLLSQYTYSHVAGPEWWCITLLQELLLELKKRFNWIKALYFRGLINRNNCLSKFQSVWPHNANEQCYICEGSATKNKMAKLRSFLRFCVEKRPGGDSGSWSIP